VTVESPAEAYDRHVGRYGAQLAAGLIEAAGVEAGWRALDVGCGPGPLTRALADRLGEESVAAVDPSEAFVEACRARVPGADVRVGVGERLPFADDEFDAVLAQLVVQLMDDREAGVREMHRVAPPGGVVAACVWNYEAMPLLRAFWDSALDVAPDRAGKLDGGQRVGYVRPEELAELWTSQGLRNVSTGEMVTEASYRDFDDLFTPFASGVGHSGGCFRALDEKAQDRVREETYIRLGRPKGRFTLSPRAWWVRGTASD
jgi:ubiquinone/menaquinone biosynthesis C-methylase UbiE